MVTVITITRENYGNEEGSEGYGQKEEEDCDGCGKQAQIEGVLCTLKFIVVFFLRQLFMLQFVVEETLTLVILIFTCDVGK